MQAELDNFVRLVLSRGHLDVPWQDFREKHFPQSDGAFAHDTAVRWFRERGITARICVHRLGWKDVEVLELSRSIV